MNFNVFPPKYPISAQFGYNFSRQTDSGAGIACFCHWLRHCSESCELLYGLWPVRVFHRAISKKKEQFKKVCA